MELRDFVSETLKEIIAGVKDAQEYARQNGACVNPIDMGIVKGSNAIMRVGNDNITFVQKVDFPLCVTDGSTHGGKVGIEVMDTIKIGEIGSNKSQTVENRVTFSVPLALPPSDNR